MHQHGALCTSQAVSTEIERNDTENEPRIEMLLRTASEPLRVPHSILVPDIVVPYEEEVSRVDCGNEHANEGSEVEASELLRFVVWIRLFFVTKGFARMCRERWWGGSAVVIREIAA